MKRAMKIRMVMAGLLWPGASILYGQAVPAGVTSVSAVPGSLTPDLSALNGVVYYALSASEIVQLGYYGSGDVTGSTTLSGDVAYNSKSRVRPFSLLLGAGVLLPNQTGQAVSGFSNVVASQGLVTKHWLFNLSDSFSFLPESPTTGLSGVAGVGDIGVIPIQGPGYGPAGGVFSAAGNRISNGLSGSLERELNRQTSVSGSASWAVLDFVGGGANANANANALNDTQIAGTVAVNRRINARSSASLSAVYSTFTYSGVEAAGFPNFQTRGLNVSYQRLLSRSFSVSGSIGPQWVSSSNSTLLPSSLSIAGNASLSYTHRYYNASVSYSRGVNSGSGVLPGAFADTVTGTVGRPYGRDWVVSLNGSYVHTSGLTQFGSANGLTAATEVFNTLYVGAQATRRIRTNLSGYASYTVQHQSSTDQFLGINALNGTSQTFGIGITFSPRSTRLGQF